MKKYLIMLLLLSGCYDEEVVCDDQQSIYVVYNSQEDRRICETKDLCSDIIGKHLDVDGVYLEFASEDRTYELCLNDEAAGCAYEDSIYVSYIDDLLESDLLCHEFIHLTYNDPNHEGPEFRALYEWFALLQLEE